MKIVHGIEIIRETEILRTEMTVSIQSVRIQMSFPFIHVRHSSFLHSLTTIGRYSHVFVNCA